jgi:hypothetical protein
MQAVLSLRGEASDELIDFPDHLEKYADILKVHQQKTETPIHDR